MTTLRRHLLATFPSKFSKEDVINFFKTKYIGDNHACVNFESLAIDFLVRWKSCGKRKV